MKLQRFLTSFKALLYYSIMERKKMGKKCYKFKDFLYFCNMKNMKIIIVLTLLFCTTSMTAQKSDAALIDSIQRNLPKNACRTIVVDNQPERASRTHLRVRGVDDSPIVINIDPEAAPKKAKKYASAKKRYAKKRKGMIGKSKRSEQKPVEQEAPKAVEMVQADTTAYAEPQDLAQNVAENNGNDKYYYGVGGLVLGALLTSPLYFRNRKKNV